MAAFETTSVSITRANQPDITQRFLLTSERYLFNPPEIILICVLARTQAFTVLQSGDSLRLPARRYSQPATPARAAT